MNDPIFFHTVQEFCEAFVHIEDTPEARLGARCMCENPCRRKTVVCVARLVDARGQELFVKLFRNMSTSNRTTVHAERLFVQDAEFAMYLQQYSHQPTTLTLFLTYNPCHFSGGHSTRPLNMSCTQQLIAFKRAHPRLELVVKCSYIYRAHWRTTACPTCAASIAPQHYAAKARNAQLGIRLLSNSEGIRLCAFEASDYELLLRFCLPKVREAWNAQGEMCAARHELDEFVARVLAKYSDANGGGVGEWLCQCCSG